MLSACALVASAQSQGYKDGIEYYKAGQYANAKTILDKTMSLPETDKALAHYYLGQTELALGNKDAALKNFQAGIADDPENGYNYVGLGALDLLAGNASAANEQFKTAQKFAKKNYEILVAIARAYYNADPVKYEKEYTKFLEKAHKDSKHTEPSIYILEGDMLVAKRDIGGAAGKYEMAINYDNTNPEGYVKYANSYFYVNPQFSIQKLEEFLKVAPNSALAQRELAENYYKGNYWKKAADMYGKYIKNPNHFPEDKARYSVLLYWGEDYPASLQVANEVLSEQPDNFQAQRMRFVDEVVLKQFDDAVKHGEEFFAKNPKANFTAIDFTSLADAYTGLGQNDKAIEVYNRGVNAIPDNADLYSGLSSAYSQAKDYKNAAVAYDKYLSLVEKPSLNDLFTASGKWLNVAATAGDDLALRQEASTNGVKYIDQVLPTVQESQKPMILERKAFLLTAGNEGNKPNQAAVDTFTELINLLESDPAYLDPANPANELRTYKNATSLVVQFYKDVDEEQAKFYSDKYRSAVERENPQQ